jgi:hypothetical protein
LAQGDEVLTRRQDVQILIDTEAVVLKYYPRTRIVHHELRRFVHGEEFRTVLEKGLEAFQKYHAKKWLSDDRGNGPLTAADAEWALTDWAPRVMAAGWKYWAVVMPEKILGEMNMKRWIEIYAEKGVTAQAFTDPELALEWLEIQ